MSVQLQESKRRIEDILKKVRELIDSNPQSIIFQPDEDDEKKEREKNRQFLRTYGNNSKRRLEIIKELTYKNYSEELLDKVKKDSQYDSVCYVFWVKKELFNIQKAKEEKVLIYIKFQFLNLQQHKNAARIISFHEAK